MKAYIAKSLVRVIIVTKAISGAVFSFNKNLHFHEMQMRGTFLAIILANKWKRHKTRYGKDLLQVKHRQMRNDLTFTGITCYQITRKRAIKLVGMVFYYANLQILVKRYFYLIHLVQRRIRDSLATKYGKVEILVTYWDKLLGRVYLKARKKND